MSQKIALVTGANRGIGFEVCRELADLGLRVILTARDQAKGQAAAKKLGVEFLPLDVTDPSSVQTLKESVEDRFGRLDVLVNNAGILLDEGTSVLETAPEVIRATLQTNLIGPWMLGQAFVPGMRRLGYGRVVNVSSTAGQLSTMSSYAPAYSISKAALNALTKQMTSAAGPKVLVNSACPGWVRTDMGGPGAPKSLREGADTIVWLATLPDDGPSGGFFEDKESTPW